ncbi:MAG: hypothetical protein ACKPKO_62845, partial [Candidatus Fonsibacter sp.]
TTTVDHIWYIAPPATWYNLGYFLGRHRKMQHAGAWQVIAAVWNDGSFTTLTVHVTLLFNREAASRKALGLSLNRDVLVVVVCTAIRHVVGPLRLVMGSVLPDGNVLRQFGLEALHPENVQIRFP